MHQCVHCGKLYEQPTKELIEGCSCGGHFFFFIKQEQYDALKDKKMPVQLSEVDKTTIEKEVREIVGAEEEEVPVILDLESVRVVGAGKFEIDVVNLFGKKRPWIYKLEEGKYVIDLASTMKVSQKELSKKIRDPTKR